MWIEISEDLPVHHAEPSLMVHSVLEAIALSSFHGRHVLYGSRFTLDWLSSLQLSAPAHAAVRRARGRIAEFGSFRNSIKKKLIIISTGDSVTLDDSENWHAPVDLITNVPFTENEVLAENLIDARVFHRAAVHYKKYIRASGVGVATSSQHGGGNEILPCLNNALIPKSRFVFAITDSDQEYPEGPTSATGKNCALAASNANWICMHVQLPCREVENFLPFNLVEDSLTADQGIGVGMIERLEQIKSILAKRPDAHRHVDLKGGTSGWLSTQSNPHEAKRQYWEGVVNSCGGNHKVNCQEACLNRSSKDCECRIVESLGDHTVSRFLSYCDTQSIAKQLERVSTSSNGEEWLKLGEKVFHWGISDEKMRV